MSDEARERSITRSFVSYAQTCGKCGARRVDQQLGLEPTPELFVARMVEVFREVRRVLRLDGVCFLNIGDSYWSNPSKGGSGPNGKNEDRWGYDRRNRSADPGAAALVASEGMSGTRSALPHPPPGLKPKDLVGIPGGSRSPSKQTAGTSARTSYGRSRTRCRSR